jgi:hypothetical protein
MSAHPFLDIAGFVAVMLPPILGLITQITAWWTL